MNKKLKDAVYGFAVGDALGVPFEFKKRDSFKCSGMVGFGTWQQPAGTFSDDTSMILATCKSIKDCGGINLEDIMKNFVLWREYNDFTARGRVFDIGMTTEKAITNYEYNMDVRKCGLKDERSNGNGSLMRILPLAFVPGVTLKEVKNVSSLTHAHKTSVLCCTEYIIICKKLLRGEEFPKVMKSRDEIKSTGYVLDTLQAAIWCFQNTNNYKDCVLTAVNLGGDTDTIAAIAGGLAGIKYGIEDIPEEWINKLANKQLIDDCLF